MSKTHSSNIRRHLLLVLITAVGLSQPILGQSKSQSYKFATKTAIRIISAKSRRDVTVITNNQRKSFDCRGGSANISGNKNTITLRGECAQVIVNGNSNVNTIETVGEIIANGNKNRISWRAGKNGADPQVNSPGSNNAINRRGR